MSSFSVRRADWGADRVALSGVREAVFMVEQGVTPELEWDGRDATAHHLLALDGSGAPIGTARLLADGHIGRMAVLEPWRGHGVGSALLGAAITWAEALAMERLVLDAQCHAIGFYQRFGFTAEGEVFLDAGIPHRRMARGG